MPGLGDEFRAAREARHLSLSDVSEQIHIRSVYLQSIENEEWSSIAAPVYVRGFIRTYARFLSLDGEAAVERFNHAIGDLAGRPQESIPLAPIDGKRRPSPWLWIAGAAALLLVAFVGFRYVQFQQDAGAQTASVAEVTPVPSAAASASAEPSAAPSTAPPTPEPKKTLELRVTAPSWVMVRVDGAQVYEGILPAGTRKAFHGSRAEVRVGNAGGVQLRLNGKDLGSMGTPGAVVERSLSLASAAE